MIDPNATSLKDLIDEALILIAEKYDLDPNMIACIIKEYDNLISYRLKYSVCTYCLN